MSCSKCHRSPCSCSCISQIDSKCVFYKGSTTSCLNIPTGATLQTIIQTIDAAICSGLPNPSGHAYISQGTANQIDVVSSTVGGATTYTISLDSTITTDISNLQSSIATLTACCNNSVKEITTSSPGLTVADNGSGSWSVDLTPPSGTPIHDGIIHNDTTKAGTTGGGGVQIIKSFNWNYVTGNGISNEDEIRFRISGQVAASSTPDTVTFQIYNTTTSTVLYSFSPGVPGGSILASSYICNASLSVISGSTALFNANTVGFVQANGTASGSPSGYFLVNADVVGIDFTNLTLRVLYTNTSGLGASNNFVRNVMVEVEKKI